MMLLHVILNCYGRKCRTRAQEVVATSMSRHALRYRASIRHRVLREPRQGIKFAQDRNHRLSMAIACNETGWLIRHSRTNGEPSRLQILLQQSGTFLFVIAELRILPD